MRIEDLMRESLRRSAGAVTEEAAPEQLWEGIERGLHHARRWATTARIAVAAFGLVVVAGTITWLSFAFTGSGRKPIMSAPVLSVRNVRVFGGPDSVKIYGRVSNRSGQPVGASLACAVLDASGRVIGQVTGSVPYIPPGASPAFGPLGDRVQGTPSSARCAARPTAAVSPSPSPVATAVFQPSVVAFWDATHGIAGGPFGDPSCFPSCTGMIQVTDDGGRTWRVSRRGHVHVYEVAVSGSRDAWVLAGSCAMGTCAIDVLFSGDGGRTWSRRSTQDLKRVSFVSADEGWGVGDLFPIGYQRLARTSDGGRTWQSRAVPCPRDTSLAIDVSFVNPARGWLLCTGEGAGGNESRAIMETTDGGSTWSTVAVAALESPSSSGFTSSGDPTGIFFLPDGHGWMWVEGGGGGMEVTADGGRSWHLVGTVPNGSDQSMGSAQFLSDTMGFAVISNGNDQANQLIETDDGGRTWHVIHDWPY
jgi:photosystem II stability/assembly factor-like uncharacterized protein